MELESIIRPHRKALVVAAEEAIKACGGDLPKKTQLNRLVTVCGEATCAEEICNYIRYQASRNSALWSREFAEHVISKIEAPLRGVSAAVQQHKHPSLDRAVVVAWRYYAVYLVRAFTYQISIRSQEKGRAHDRARG